MVGCSSNEHSLAKGIIITDGRAISTFYSGTKRRDHKSRCWSKHIHLGHPE